MIVFRRKAILHYPAHILICQNLVEGVRVDFIAT